MKEAAARVADVAAQNGEVAARRSRFLQQLAFYGVGLVAIGLFLTLFSGILLPFVLAMALAYMLDPVVDRLEGRGVGRTLATAMILGTVVLLLGLALALLAPVALRQLTELAKSLPDLATRADQLFREYVLPIVGRLGVTLPGTDELQRNMGEVAGQGAGWLTAVASRLWSGGQALIAAFSLLVLTPVIAFYLIVDFDRMVATVDRHVPRVHVDTVRTIARRIHGRLAGFIRGQSLVCLFLAAFYSIGLTLAGLRFGLLIGLIAGALTFIPYVGSLTGFVLSVGVALVQFLPEWGMVGVIIAIFALGQFLEGNIVTPKLVGDSVGLHPVWLIFALLAGGQLFGFVGLLVAVPVAAAIGVLVEFTLERYRESELYEKASVKPLPSEDAAITAAAAAAVVAAEAVRTPQHAG